jgi:hypothetical protein
VQREQGDRWREKGEARGVMEQKVLDGRMEREKGDKVSSSLE